MSLLASMPLVVALIGVALVFDFLNGLHDSANSIATIVSTRVLSPRYAVLWAAFFNFVAFLVFGLPQRPHARHAYFAELLLPYLHMALQRVGDGQARARAGALARPVSAREAEILHWVREGKSNDEIGMILGISGLTVKNHLQRLYRLLGVSNRAQAIARGMGLQLFDRAPLLLARAA